MAEENFGKILQRLRKEKGATQEQVADAMGVSLQAVSKWENGSFPNGDILPRLADYFGVSIDFLYGREKREISLEQQILENMQMLAEDEKDSGWDYSLRFEQTFRYFWAMQVGYWKDNKEYYDRNPKGRDGRTGLSMTCKNGFSYMRLNDDLEYLAMMKEPEGGFASFFHPSEELAHFFEMFSKKEYLEILFYMLSLDNAECVSSSTVAKKLKLSEECVEHVLDYFSGASERILYNTAIIRMTQLDEQNKKHKVYLREEVLSAQVLLLLAAADGLLNPAQSYALRMGMRETGWLSDKENKGEA